VRRGGGRAVARADGTPVERSLGCGLPTAVAGLRDGDIVLDLGSGGSGADVLISARRVGPSGRVIGLDTTDGMLDLGRANAAAAGIDNVEFVRGYLKELPLPDASVDVVISNCVINLSEDKARVFREAARPAGGRARGDHDVIADADMDDVTRVDTAHWTGRIAGALTRRGVRALAHGGRPRGHRDPRDPSRPRARRRSDGPRAQAGALLQRLAFRYAPPSTHAPRSRSLPSKFS
jgi:SAM-dependent methyltransferase